MVPIAYGEVNRNSSSISGFAFVWRRLDNRGVPIDGEVWRIFHRYSRMRKTIRKVDNCFFRHNGKPYSWAIFKYAAIGHFGTSFSNSVTSVSNFGRFSGRNSSPGDRWETDLNFGRISSRREIWQVCEWYNNAMWIALKWPYFIAMLYVFRPNNRRIEIYNINRI